MLKCSVSSNELHVQREVSELGKGIRFWIYFTTVSVVDADIQIPVLLLIALLPFSISIPSASPGLSLEVRQIMELKTYQIRL